MKISKGKACHTFGELLQGQVNGRPFLVSLPIQHFVEATFHWEDKGQLKIIPEKEKVRQLWEKVVKEQGLSTGGTLVMESSLPVGKGFATSSADMLAALRALSTGYGLSLSQEKMAALLSSIEPTDGIMYDALVAFYHREGLCFQNLGYLPPLTLVGVDRGGKVDTVTYNQKDRSYSSLEEKEYEALLEDLMRALLKGDAAGIGKVSTRSAELHQKRLPYPYFSEMLQICQEEGGVGVVIAHSGTLAGILVDEREKESPEKVAHLVKRLEEWGNTIYQFRVGARKKEEQQWPYNLSAGAGPSTVRSFGPV